MGSLFDIPEPTVPAPPPPPPDPPKTSVTDPDAVSNARKRASAELSRRGRSSLKIPLGGASSSGSGVAIPK